MTELSWGMKEAKALSTAIDLDNLEVIRQIYLEETLSQNDIEWMIDAIEGLRLLLDHEALVHGNDCTCATCRSFIKDMVYAKNKGWLYSKKVRGDKNVDERS